MHLYGVRMHLLKSTIFILDFKDNLAFNMTEEGLYDGTVQAFSLTIKDSFVIKTFS